eukprot:1145536-Pelagomonas_calceolata.AAC.2
MASNKQSHVKMEQVAKLARTESKHPVKLIFQHVTHTTLCHDEQQTKSCQAKHQRMQLSL